MMKRKLNRTVRCLDGFSMSVQASESAYCYPRRDNAFAYSEVEIGYPSRNESLIIKYAENPADPRDTVYPYVPSPLVLEVIKKHGGIRDGEIPPLDLTPGTSE